MKISGENGEYKLDNSIILDDSSLKGEEKRMRKIKDGDLVLCPDENPLNWDSWKFFMFEVDSSKAWRPKMWMSFSREELLLLAESMGKKPVWCDFEVYISDTCSKRRIVPARRWRTSSRPTSA